MPATGFAARLRTARRSAGFKQHDVCENTAGRVTPTRLSLLERGLEPRLSEVEALADAIGVPADLLAFGPDEA